MERIDLSQLKLVGIILAASGNRATINGSGATDLINVPLGTSFDFDAQGICTRANLVIPTAQNLANLEADMRVYIPRIAELSEDKMACRLESLVRAYDPCISCATHVIVR